VPRGIHIYMLEKGQRKPHSICAPFEYTQITLPAQLRDLD